jgi:hypothetical protein
MIQIYSTIENDLPQLAQIYASAYNAVNIGENWTNEPALEIIKYFYKLQPNLFFTAKEDEVIVGGIVSLLKPWWDGI